MIVPITEQNMQAAVPAEQVYGNRKRAHSFAYTQGNRDFALTGADMETDESILHYAGIIFHNHGVEALRAHRLPVLSEKRILCIAEQAIIDGRQGEITWRTLSSLAEMWLDSI